MEALPWRNRATLVPHANGGFGSDTSHLAQVFVDRIAAAKLCDDRKVSMYGHSPRLERVVTVMQERITGQTVFAERVLARAEQLGLSQAAVARRIWPTGVVNPPRRLNNYLNPRTDTGRVGEPDLHTLIKICWALQTHPNYLLGFSSNPEPPRG